VGVGVGVGAVAETVVDRELTGEILLGSAGTTERA
jgi:hypothetical protein